MLVTIFLVETIIYGSVEGPSTREFSYIEVWYAGVLIPIVFALIEYGITLGVMKYKGKNRELKNFAEGTTVEDVFNIADLTSFICCAVFILIFFVTYLIICIHA